MLTLAASLSKCDNFGASDLSVFEFVEGVAECGDFEGGFGWGELAGVEDEVGLGHGEGGQGAGGVECVEELDGVDLLEGASGGVVEALPELGEWARDLDGVDVDSGARREVDKVGDELAADGVLGYEGEDEAGEVSEGGALDDGEPEGFAELDEGFAAEFEDGEERVGGEVVVEELIAGGPGELFADGELAGGG